MSNRYILLIEDNSDDEALTLRALKKNQIQCRVEICRDGEEALDYLFARGQFASRAEHDMPELILLDLKLPKIGGLEVLSEIRRHPQTRLLPVVILTTSNEASDIRTSYQSGANSYIRKPVDFDQFMEAIRQMANYWLLLNESPLQV